MHCTRPLSLSVLQQLSIQVHVGDSNGVAPVIKDLEAEGEMETTLERRLSQERRQMIKRGGMLLAWVSM